MDYLQGMCTLLFVLKQHLYSEDRHNSRKALSKFFSFAKKYPFVMEQIDESIKISPDEKLQIEAFKAVKNSRNNKISPKKPCPTPGKNNQPLPQNLITTNKFEILNEISSMDTDNVIIIQNIETVSPHISDWRVESPILPNAT